MKMGTFLLIFKVDFTVYYYTIVCYRKMHIFFKMHIFRQTDRQR